MLMPESIPKQIAESPACDVLEMLHSWWLAESHLDRLQSQHKLKTQDLQKHRETALEYLKYFESTVLPSKTTDAPRGTRIQRVEELWGYRFGSLQHYDRLKAWLHEGEDQLDYIKAHLARTLAAMQGCQGNVPDASAPELQGREADLHKALYDLLQDHHKSLLAWKESQRKGGKGGKAGKTSVKPQPGASPKVTDAEGKQSANCEEESSADADAISKGSSDGIAPAESPSSVKVQNADQAAYGKGKSADILKLKQQLREEQAQVRKLEGRLEDANRASEYHRVEMQRMQACMQAGQRASKMSEEAFEEAERREEELKQENKKILSDLTIARQAARQAEHLVLEQALELDRAHITNATLAQVNDNLQAQVTNLQGDNFSFQSRVTSLQETTSSLSTQINALAQQAQAAASVSNQVKVLKNVAASLQRERDIISAQSQKTKDENDTLSAKVADLTRQLDSASSQIKSLSKDEGSPKQDSSSKGKASPKSETPDPQQETEGGGRAIPVLDGAHSGSLTDAQAAVYEATIKQLKDQLKEKQVHQDLKAAKEVKQEGKSVEGGLIKSAVARALSPSQSTLPAPQISPASPPKPDSSSA
ncbi:hypothetical protein ABBQ38_007819 [Trebouxia sp. C0009 RCD-2024]